MKPKSIERMNYLYGSPCRNDKPEPPLLLVNSVNNSAQRSSRSIHHSERSSSTKKIMIPNSHKLANFFEQPRALSSQKSYSTTSTQYLINKQKLNQQQQVKRKEKLQFLNFNVNRDYFDQYTEHHLKDNLQKYQSRTLKKAEGNGRLDLQQVRGRDNQIDSRQNNYASVTSLKSQKQLGLPKLKYHNSNSFPIKAMVRPIDKIISSKQKKIFHKKYETHPLAENKSKRQSRNQLQYTFGLNY